MAEFREMPEACEVLELDGIFSAEQVHQFHKGFSPSTKVDRWIIRFEEDNLHFYRAKTLAKIFELRFDPKDDHFIAYELVVNRDPKQYMAISAEFDVQLVAFLIDTYLLGRSPSFPFPKNLKAQHREKFLKNMIGRTSPRLSQPTVTIDKIQFN